MPPGKSVRSIPESYLITHPQPTWSFNNALASAASASRHLNCCLSASFNCISFWLCSRKYASLSLRLARHLIVASLLRSRSQARLSLVTSDVLLPVSRNFSSLFAASTSCCGLPFLVEYFRAVGGSYPIERGFIIGVDVSPRGLVDRGWSERRVLPRQSFRHWIFADTFALKLTVVSGTASESQIQDVAEVFGSIASWYMLMLEAVFA